MGATRRKPDEKTRALALPSGRFLDRAEDELYEIGFYEDGGDGVGGHYVTTTVRVGRLTLPAIRSVKGDREVLGDIAKQLACLCRARHGRQVIAGIPFRLVTVR